MTVKLVALFLLLPVSIGVAAAQTPAEMQARYAAEARKADPSFRGFSAAEGERFFRARHGGEWSCASCHTGDPRTNGRHAVTGRTLKPMAPAANPARFSDPAKVEKWFRRNCRDVLDRECTAVEKGNILAWLTSPRAGGR